jgi:hypothetical protein
MSRPIHKIGWILAAGLFLGLGFILIWLSISGEKPPPSRGDAASLLNTLDENLILKTANLSQYEHLIHLFDKKWEAFCRHPERKSVDGFFLSALDPFPLRPIRRYPGARYPEDAAYEADEFRGYRMAVSSNRKTLYVSLDKDFSKYHKVRPGEEIPPLRHYYLDRIEDGQLKLLWGNLKPNYNLCESFLEMFRITGRKKYLRPAKDILLYLIDRLDEDGQYRLPFPGSPLKYRAIYQSYLLRILQDYIRLSPSREPALEEGLQRIGRAFRFTDEGVWDHFLEAVIGLAIVEKLGIQTVSWDWTLKKIQALYVHILGHDGRIPFSRRRRDPPQTIWNYHNYNTMLLAELSAKYLQKDIGLEKIFPLIFQAAKKNGDRRLFRGLYYAKLQFRFDDPEWARQKEVEIWKSDSFIEIPFLLKYQILSDVRKPPIPAEARPAGKAKKPARGIR